MYWGSRSYSSRTDVLVVSDRPEGVGLVLGGVGISRDGCGSERQGGDVSVHPCVTCEVDDLAMTLTEQAIDGVPTDKAIAGLE
jgi:hypothetical protein